jgi:hypothetical protein
MSERLNQHHEDAHEIGKQDFDKYERKLERNIESKAENARHEHKESIDKILKTIEREAKKSGETGIERKTPETSRGNAHAGTVTADLRNQALKSNLKKVQKELSSSEKRFSRMVHNPSVEMISEAASKTIARPSGLLFGGIFALVSNVVVLFVIRYYGYEYNYLIGAGSFIVGFFFGLVIEFIYRKLVKHRP